MKEGTYFIPIKIELKAENPEAVMKMIGDTIFEALTEKFDEKGFSDPNSPVRGITVDYSLYGKMDAREEEKL